MRERVQCVILGGGRGTRLYPLTKVRAKPAVPIGGKYRLIDVPISNSLHADIDRIYVLTQFNSASLHRHIKRTYSFDTFSEGFVDILAAEQSQAGESWYQGTADAVRQRLRNVLHGRPLHVLILSGDHLYRMDYGAFVAEHLSSGADLSIAAKVVDRGAAPTLGVFRLDPNGHVAGFREKPQTDAELDTLALPGGDENAGAFVASMGIYLFRASTLERVLEETSGADFGRDIIPATIRRHHVHAHRFRGYWVDVGTIGSFYEANLALTEPSPPFSFHLPNAPIYTRPRYLAGARIDGCRIDRAIVGDGSELHQCSIAHSLVGLRSTVRPGARIVDTVLMGADYYASDEGLAQERGLEVPLGIGERTVVERAIIDKNACIGRDVRIRGAAGMPDVDTDSYSVRDGVVVIPKNAVIPDGTVIEPS